MNAYATVDIQKEIQPVNASEKLNSLVVELEHYRRQSEWLSCVNELHARLAGAVDLPAMIEAFSIWLMPLVNHDLIAYQNPERERVHMFCSCHGPERREIVGAADQIFTDWPEERSECSLQRLCRRALLGEHPDLDLAFEQCRYLAQVRV